MAFDKVPSELDEFFWDVTLEDLKHRVRLFFSEKLIDASQVQESLVEVIKMALGSEDQKEIESPANFEEAQAKLNSLFGM